MAPPGTFSADFVIDLLIIRILADSRNDDESSGSHELVKISKFLENPTIITRVKCQEVTYAGYFHEW